jgi:hypothetical protein
MSSLWKCCRVDSKVRDPHGRNEIRRMSLLTGSKAYMGFIPKHVVGDGLKGPQLLVKSLSIVGVVMKQINSGSLGLPLVIPKQNKRWTLVRSRIKRESSSALSAGINSKSLMWPSSL